MSTRLAVVQTDHGSASTAPAIDARANDKTQAIKSMQVRSRARTERCTASLWRGRGCMVGALASGWSRTTPAERTMSTLAAPSPTSSPAAAVCNAAATCRAPSC